MQILVVDDQPINRQIICSFLKQHQLYQAGNGQEAIELFKQHEIDLIIMDIVMPVMDGYAAAKVLRDLIQDRYVPIIFLTARNDEASLAECIESGGDDFLAKPIKKTLLDAKINAHYRIRQLTQQLYEQNQKLRFHSALMDREHEIVEKVFANAMKQSFLDCENLRHYISPMSAFNGDIFLVTQSENQDLYVFLGDFTGHGLSAAIGSLPTSRIFFTMANKGLPVSEIAAEINDALEQFLPVGMFCAATLMHLDTSGQRLTVWSGGLPDAYIISPSGKLISPIQSTHMPLGALERAEFESDVQVFQMSPGQQVYLYTDGVVEARAADGEMFGQERFNQTLHVDNPDRFQQVIDTLMAFRGAGAQNDDVSLVELTCRPIEQVQSKIEPARLPVPDMHWSMQFDINADQMRVDSALPQINAVISTLVQLDEHKDLLQTLMGEIYSNALEHGILQLSSAMKRDEDSFLLYYQERQSRLDALEDASIQVNLTYYPKPMELNPCLRIQVQDSGTGFDYNRVLADITRRTAEEDEHVYGRGLELICSLCSSVKFSDEGRHIDVCYSLDKVMNDLC